MKRVVAIGLVAGMALGFFLGALVTRHDDGERIVVIHNATDETLGMVSIMTEDLPENQTYGIEKLEPHHTSTVRMLSHRPMALNVRANTADGKELPSQKIYFALEGVVFALVSSDGITLQYEPKR